MLGTRNLPFQLWFGRQGFIETVGGLGIDSGCRQFGARDLWVGVVMRFWQRLVAYDAGNYLMATAASTSRIERLSGLVDGHAYSLLHVREVPLEDGEKGPFSSISGGI